MLPLLLACFDWFVFKVFNFFYIYTVAFQPIKTCWEFSSAQFSQLWPQKPIFPFVFVVQYVFFISFISKSGYCKSFKSTGKKRRRKKTTPVLHMSYYGLIMSVMPASYDRSTVFGLGPRIALQTMCRKQCLCSHSVSVGKLLWGYPAQNIQVGSPMRTSVAMHMYLYKYSLISTNLIF